MRSYSPTTRRMRPSRTWDGASGRCVSRSRRSAPSRAAIAMNAARGRAEAPCAASAIDACSTTATTAHPTRTLVQLRIHLLEIAAIHEHLARLAARAGGDEALGL